MVAADSIDGAMAFRSSRGIVPPHTAQKRYVGGLRLPQTGHAAVEPAVHDAGDAWPVGAGEGAGLSRGGGEGGIAGGTRPMLASAPAAGAPAGALGTLTGPGPNEKLGASGRERRPVGTSTAGMPPCGVGVRGATGSAAGGGA